MKKRSKSEIEVLAHVAGTKHIQHHSKHHVKALAALKAEGAIEAGPYGAMIIAQPAGIELPLRTTISHRWTTAVWKRHAGRKVIAFVAYGDTRAASMDAADVLVDLIKQGLL